MATMSSTVAFFRDRTPNVHIGPKMIPETPKPMATSAAIRRFPPIAVQPTTQNR